MLLSEDKVRNRLASPANLAARFAKSEPEPNLEVRKNCQKRFIPRSVRNAAAFAGAVGLDTQQTIADNLGVSQMEVSLLASGKVASDVPVAKIDQVLEKTMSHARDLALSRLLSTLGFIDDEKLERATLKDLSTMAGAMSKVIDKTMPHHEKDSGVTLVVYAPEIKSESAFRVIEVNKNT
jgi:predicted transcriptional regulator